VAAFCCKNFSMCTERLNEKDFGNKAELRRLMCPVLHVSSPRLLILFRWNVIFLVHVKSF
jgi:hypothetical protein